MTRTPSTRPNRKLVLGAALGLALTGVGVPVVQAATSSADSTTAVGTASATASQLTEMREEERLARDVYTTLAESSGSAIFTRIASSEQRHMDAVEQLMENRGIATDTLGETVGDYSVDAFDGLYAQWVKDGSVSADAAYKVGVDLENRDIADLKALPDGLDADVQRVVAALLNGSEHHLAAFTAASEGNLPATAGTRTGQGMRFGRNGGTGQMGQYGPGDGTCLTDGDDSTPPGSQSRGAGMGGAGYGRGPAWDVSD